MKTSLILALVSSVIALSSCGGGGGNANANGTSAPSSLGGATLSINPTIVFDNANNFTYSNTASLASFSSDFHTTDSGDLLGTYVFTPNGVSSQLVLDFTDPDFNDYTMTLSQFGVDIDNFIISATARVTSVSSVVSPDPAAKTPPLNVPLLTSIPTNQISPAVVVNAGSGSPTGLNNFTAGRVISGQFVSETKSTSASETPLLTPAVGATVQFVIESNGSLSFNGNSTSGRLMVPFTVALNNVNTYETFQTSGVPGSTLVIETLKVTINKAASTGNLIVTWSKTLPDDGSGGTIAPNHELKFSSTIN